MGQIINILHETHFVHISDILADILSSCLFFNLLSTVKMLEMAAYYADTGTKTLPPFINSSIDNVLLQTNPSCSTHFLNLQSSLYVIWWRHCCVTVKPCNPLAAGNQRSGLIEFIEGFSFISTHDLLGRFSPGNAKAEAGCGKNLDNNLIATCIGDIFCQKLLNFANLFSSYNR